MLRAASCMLRAASCMLRVACCKLHVACCVLQVACCLLRAASCMCVLRAASCVLQEAMMKHSFWLVYIRLTHKRAPAALAQTHYYSKARLRSRGQSDAWAVRGAVGSARQRLICVYFRYSLGLSLCGWAVQGGRPTRQRALGWHTAEGARLSYGGCHWMGGRAQRHPHVALYCA
jgi:hypothetical protein